MSLQSVWHCTVESLEMKEDCAGLPQSDKEVALELRVHTYRVFSTGNWCLFGFGAGIIHRLPEIVKFGYIYQAVIKYMLTRKRSLLNTAKCDLILWRLRLGAIYPLP